jgi:uncharacterized protein (TIGR02996 family)
VDPEEAFLVGTLVAPDEWPLLAAVMQAPKDRQQRLVYADWLEEHGGRESVARAGLLRLQARPRKERAAATSREEELRSRIAPAWLSLVGDTQARLREKFARVREAADEGDGGRLQIKGGPGLLDLRYVSGFWHWNHDMLAFLGTREVAPVLRSLLLTSDGLAAANGTCEIFIERLLEGGHPFTNLVRFQVDANSEDGTPVIGGLEGEGGFHARLLALAPALEILDSPSAPDAGFFQVGRRPLTSLRLAAGFDDQGFIANLARSSCFPGLRTFVWFDFDHTATSFEDCLVLFQSPVGARLERLVLRNMSLTEGQVGQLRGIRAQGVQITRAYGW